MLKKLYNIANRVIRDEKSKGTVSITLVDDKAIRKLNRKYRKIDRATDVLSFEMDEDGILGDIAVSEPTAKRNAKRFGCSYKDEMKRLVIHGTLHLLGYDHIKAALRVKMREKEDHYAKKIR